MEGQVLCYWGIPYLRLLGGAHPISPTRCIWIRRYMGTRGLNFYPKYIILSLSNRNVVSLLTWESKQKINLFFLFSFTLDLKSGSDSPIFCKEFHSIVSPAAWTLLCYNHVFIGSHTNNCVEQPLGHDYPAMIICGFVSHFLKLGLPGISPPHVVLCELQLLG